ncbi:immunoglobulin-like domain-containing protein, partial [Paraclostridium sordellii]
VSNWAKPYIEGAIENGYLKGDNLKNLRPTSQITRAESVTLLSRIENKEIVKSDEDKKENDEAIELMIKDKKGYPVLNYHLVTYDLVKGEIWSNDRINATAFDKNHKPLKVNYEGNVDINTPGYYTVKISATDAEGRTTTEEVYVEVEDPHIVENRPIYPLITSRDLELKKGDHFDYKMLETTATDVNEKDIADTITYTGNVDTNKEGRYPVIISATDDKGLKTTLLVFVYVD